MDPVSQIFAQAAAPTGKWDGATQAFMEGRRMRQQQQQFDSRLALEKDELAGRNAMQALHAESTRLVNTERGLDIEMKMLLKERELQVKMGQADAMKLLMRSSTEGWTPGLEKETLDLFDKFSVLNGDKIAGQPLLQSMFLAREQKQAAIRMAAAEEHAKANKLVSVRETVPTPSGGTATFVKHSTPASTSDSTTEFERNLAALPPAEQTRLRQMSALKAASPNKQDYLELRDARKAAVAANDLEEVKALDLRLAFLNKSGDSATAGTASGGIPLTTARVTELQKDKATVQETIATGLATLPRWGAGTTGPGATLRRVAGATVGQVFESAQSQDVAQMDISAATFKTLAVKLLKTDSQIAEAERTALEKTIPSPGMTLPAETASWKQQQLMLYTIKRGKRVADNLGEEFDPVGIANQVRSAVESSGQPIIDEFKTIDELTTEMRVRGQGKTKAEHIALSTQYSRKIKESVFYTAPTAAPQSATTPLPRRPLRK